MTKQTNNLKESNYITTIRDEETKAVAANIFRGRSPDGVTYLYCELSRSFMTSTGKKGYSKKLMGQHAQAVGRVAAKAKDWMEQNPQAADGNLESSAAQE